MLVSLYTSRVVLNTLGIEDFGIYNVVGGIVTMFGFLNASMSSATQRFLSFELGRRDFKKLREVFCMSLNIHFLIAGIVLILAETIGLWFLNNQMVIPLERVIAANWVYQFSIAAFIVTIISVPYNASIIAYERMNVFAYISILEVSLKLLVVFILQWSNVDKLKLYAVLLFLVSLLIRIIYGIYCKRKIASCSYTFVKDKELFKTLFSYAGWNLWGNLASVTMGQGINILLNLFFGPVINAARGIAYQVSNAVNQFSTSFQMAVNPQIIKSYASDNRIYMHQLIFSSAKYSFFLLFALALPILLETEFILTLWLKIVPEKTVLFTRLVIAIVLIDCMSGPLMTAAQASGKIKVYQSVVGGLLLLILPISYIFLKLGFPPETTMLVNLAISIIALFVRLWIITPLVGLSVTLFIKSVLVPVSLVTTFSIILPGINFYITEESALRIVSTFILSFMSVILSIYYIGLNQSERERVLSKVKIILNKYGSK